MQSVWFFYAMHTKNCLNASFILKSENPLVLSAQRGLDRCKMIVMLMLGWNFNQALSLLLVLSSVHILRLNTNYSIPNIS
jgi:hypothetical protein